MEIKYSLTFWSCIRGNDARIFLLAVRKQSSICRIKRDVPYRIRCERDEQMMSCSFGEVRAYRNAARVPGQFKRPLSPELWQSVDRVVLSDDIGLIVNLHGLFPELYLYPLFTTPDWHFKENLSYKGPALPNLLRSNKLKFPNNYLNHDQINDSLYDQLIT